jgi:hypothetical protein
MKNKIFNLKEKKEQSTIKYNKLDLKKVIEKNSFELFKIRIIANNYYFEKDNTDYIEDLGIDENNQLVIFEYRIGKMGKVVQNGFLIIDYILKHASQFKMLCNDILGVEEAKRINYSPRLIVLGDHFHRYDFESLKGLPYQVELNEIIMFDDSLLVNRTYINKRSDLTKLIEVKGEARELFIELRNFCFYLGEEVVEYGYDNIVTYRRVNNFLLAYFTNDLHVCVQNKDYVIKSIDDIISIGGLIEEEYDKN